MDGNPAFLGSNIPTGAAPALAASGLAGHGSFWDSSPEEASEPVFHEIVALARLITGAEAAVMSVLDHERVWLRARAGVDVRWLPQAAAFSTYTMSQDALLEIPDTHAAPAYADHPLVQGRYAGLPALRSYAHVPLHSAAPERIYYGALCVFGTRPHRLTPEGRAGLADLGQRLERLLHAREGTRRDPATGFHHAAVMAGLVQRAAHQARHCGGALSLIGLAPQRPITDPGARRRYASRVASILLGHGELAGEAAAAPGDEDPRLLLLLPGSAPVHAEAIAAELRDALALPGLLDDGGHPARFGLGVAGQVWTGPGTGAAADAEAPECARRLMAEALARARAEP